MIDLPKNIQMGKAPYLPKAQFRPRSYNPAREPDAERVEQAMELLARAERPIFYVGGGVINSGPRACALLTELVRETGYPITLTLMGLGAYPASDPQFVGMLGMHGTYEANMAMHDCDVMVCIGARFDDRVTGRLDGFSPQAPQDPRRHRPVLDQQEHPGRRGDRGRCRAHAGRHAGGLEAALEQHQPRQGPALVEPDRGLEPGRLAALPAGPHRHQAAIRRPPPLRG